MNDFDKKLQEQILSVEGKFSRFQVKQLNYLRGLLLAGIIIVMLITLFPVKQYIPVVYKSLAVGIFVAVTMVAMITPFVIEYILRKRADTEILNLEKLHFMANENNDFLNEKDSGGAMREPTERELLLRYSRYRDFNGYLIMFSYCIIGSGSMILYMSQPLSIVSNWMVGGVASILVAAPVGINFIIKKCEIAERLKVRNTGPRLNTNCV